MEGKRNYCTLLVQSQYLSLLRIFSQPLRKNSLLLGFFYCPFTSVCQAEENERGLTVLILLLCRKFNLYYLMYFSFGFSPRKT